MKPLTALSLSLIMSSTALAYGPDTYDWRVVNDTVMGGISSSSATQLEDGLVRFAGILSLENNGGFASIRADSREFALPSDGELILKVRGDGRTYTVDLRTSRRQGAFSYKQAFETQAGETIEVRLPLSNFRPTAFGRRMPQVSGLNPGNVTSFGFMLAEKKPGPFRLDILSVAFQAAEASDVSTPADLIDLAISHGVPLFNRGDHDACAAVYETTAKSLMMMSDENVPGKVKAQLMKDMEAMKPAMSAGEKAWALRRALDRARAEM